MWQLKPTLFLLLTFIYSGTGAQTISTISGIAGQFGYNGDGGLADTALLSLPSQAVPDGTGNIYIADFYNNRIRKINSAGIISTIAGNGTMAHSGDGGPATAASLAGAQNVTIDRIGNLYICESEGAGAWIRKVNMAGMISTVAGNGTTYSGDGGPATSTGLSTADAAVDSEGNIFIADFFSHRIRKINTAGIITTIGGNGVAGNSGDNGPATAAEIAGPYGIAVDGMGSVYFTDRANNNVRKISSSGIIYAVAGTGTPHYSGDGGPATAAELYAPWAITVDGAGNIYIADAGNSRVRQINTSGIINTVAGNGLAGYGGDGGPAIDASLDLPISVAIDGGNNIYISDGRQSVIRKVTVPNTGTIPLEQHGFEYLRISPNPNQGVFSLLVVSPTNENAQVTITNILGEKIKECAVPTNKQTAIELDVASGMYFLAAVTGEGVVSGKVVVK